MGYTTEFEGHFTITPPLNQYEVTYLRAFARTRHVRTPYGPYVVTIADGHDTPPVPITDHNHPPDGVPGLWCQWEASGDGTQLAWDGGEKFYESEEWLRYLVDTFLRPGAALRGDIDTPLRTPGWVIPDALTHFTFDHVVSGAVLARGEQLGDVWTLVAEDNVVRRVEGHHPHAVPSPVAEAASPVSWRADVAPLGLMSYDRRVLDPDGTFTLRRPAPPLVSENGEPVGVVTGLTLTRRGGRQWLRLTGTVNADVADAVLDGSQPQLELLTGEGDTRVVESPGEEPWVLFTGGVVTSLLAGGHPAFEDARFERVANVTKDDGALAPLDRDEACGVLQEGVHTALRKGIDCDGATTAWQAIANLPPREWHAAIGWLIDSLDDAYGIVLARRSP